MRAKIHPSFCVCLIKIENAQERVNLKNKIKLPSSLIVPFTIEKESFDTLFIMTCSNLHTSFFGRFKCHPNNKE